MIPAAGPAGSGTAERRAWPMLRAVVGVGLACGAVIVTVHRATEPIIRSNLIAARERAVLQVLPGSAAARTFVLSDDGSRFRPAAADAQQGRLVFAGYDAQGALVGLALEAQATGYQDVVRVVYGYRPRDAAIVGLRVLDSRETPGLGDRVETDADFVANFAELDVRLDAAGAALARPIEVVDAGQKQHPWQIDCISGATITSRAVARMVADSAAEWIPLVTRRLADFAGQD